MGRKRDHVPVLVALELLWDGVEDRDSFPFTIPAVRSLDRLALDQPVVFLVGENGSGKSTLIEGIAVAAGFGPEGGRRGLQFETRATSPRPRSP
ncbi:MAG: hypothetical protein JWO62_7 [Acidimicrobiaceae bacterium]|nr:hypothetical protein [Acidimicrobiaceae bacterium]